MIVCSLEFPYVFTAKEVAMAGGYTYSVPLDMLPCRPQNVAAFPPLVVGFDVSCFFRRHGSNKVEVYFRTVSGRATARRARYVGTLFRTRLRSPLAKDEVSSKADVERDDATVIGS